MPDAPGAEFRAYAVLGQVAVEMVAPLLAGLAADAWLCGTLPWLTVLGAVLGLGIGVARLVAFAAREDAGRRRPGEPPTPP